MRSKSKLILKGPLTEPGRLGSGAAGGGASTCGGGSTGLSCFCCSSLVEGTSAAGSLERRESVMIITGQKFCHSKCSKFYAIMNYLQF